MKKFSIHLFQQVQDLYSYHQQLLLLFLISATELMFINQLIMLLVLLLLMITLNFLYQIQPEEYQQMEVQLLNMVQLEMKILIMFQTDCILELVCLKGLLHILNQNYQIVTFQNLFNLISYKYKLYQKMEFIKELPLIEILFRLHLILLIQDLLIDIKINQYSLLQQLSMLLILLKISVLLLFMVVMHIRQENVIFL